LSQENNYPDSEENSRFAALCHKVEENALRLIARAEQNSLGLTAKLERKGYDSAAVKAVISGLIEQDLLNDERYAELWLCSHLKKCAKSPKWLQVSLQKRGICHNFAIKAIKKVLDPDTEYSLLFKYIEGLQNSENSEDRNTVSLRSHLKYEGFSSETLGRYFNDF